MRIFSFYEPKIYAFIMILMAGINSLAFPALGYIVAKLQFQLIKSVYDPLWYDEQLDLIYYFIGLCLILGIVGGIEKGLFGVTGENLSFNVRRDLIKGILFKQV